MSKAVGEAIAKALEAALGDDLVAVYRYDGPPIYFAPGVSPKPLILVTADDTTLPQIRDAFQPLREQEAEEPVGAPLVANRCILRRHLRLHPVLAHYLATQAVWLTGTPLALGQAQPAAREGLAYLAQQALFASSALAPELLSTEEVAVAERRLEELLSELTGSLGKTGASTAPLSGGPPETTAERFAVMQLALQQRIGTPPAEQGSAEYRQVSEAGEPNLRSVYDETDRVVAVLPRLSPSLLAQIGWDQLTERLLERGNVLRATTAAQLRLVLQWQNPLDVALERYQLSWGEDLLAHFSVSDWSVFREAARIPSTLLVRDLPTAYLAAGGDEGLHKVVHDFQNRLLNIRLQQELLQRLRGAPAVLPPEPLPGREAPVGQRIDAIYRQLDWWAEHYTSQMEATPPPAIAAG